MAGKGQAKGGARHKELGRRDGSPANTYAANVTRHRDMDVRGQTALLGAEVLATPGCRRWTEILHPRIQGMIATAAFVNRPKQKGVCVLMLSSGALTEAGQIQAHTHLHSPAMTRC